VGNAAQVHYGLEEVTLVLIDDARELSSLTLTVSLCIGLSRFTRVYLVAATGVSYPAARTATVATCAPKQRQLAAVLTQKGRIAAATYRITLPCTQERPQDFG